MMRFTLSSLPLLLALLPACAPLEVLTEGTCGNGVIEEENGEDCDSRAANGFECQAPGEPWQCSFKCAKDGACPPDYGCGTDGICRRPMGTFSDLPFVDVPSSAGELLAGDFDNDGRQDVVGVEPGYLQIHFYGAAGELHQTTFSSGLPPAIGKLGTIELPPSGGSAAGSSDEIDETDDLVLPRSLGIGALASRGDRTFAAQTYTSFSFPRQVMTMEGLEVTVNDFMPVVLDALPGDDEQHAGDELGMLISGTVEGAVKEVVFSDFKDLGSFLYRLKDVDLERAEWGPLIGAFDKNSCQQFGLPMRGESTLKIYRTCEPGVLSYGWFRAPLGAEAKVVLAEIDLDGESINGPAFTFNVNGDKALDIIITTSVGKDAGLYQLKVAYGLGDGHFNSTPPADPTQFDDKAGPYFALSAASTGSSFVPLAVGDINNDSFFDVVDNRRVLFGSDTGFLATYVSKRPWAEAVIADINANGYPDVIAAPEGDRNIDVLGGNPSKLINPLELPTAGAPARLTVGDYDGDLVNDIAFSDAPGEDGTPLKIAYGRPSGWPEDSALVGTFPQVDGVFTGNNYSLGADHISDLGVAVKPAGQDISLSFFPGSSNRFLVVPLFLLNPLERELHTPLRAALGVLKPPPEGVRNDLAVLAFRPVEDHVSIFSEEGLAQSSERLRLWNILDAGHARVTEGSAIACHVPFGAFYSPPLEGALSVTISEARPGSGGHVVLSAPRLDPTNLKEAGGLIAVMSSEGDGCDVMSMYQSGPGELFYKVRTADLNGNGTPEILAIRRRFNLEVLSSVLSSPTAIEPDQSELVVFWDSIPDGPGGPGGQDQPVGPTLAEPYTPGSQPVNVTDYAIGDILSDGLDLPQVFVLNSEGITPFLMNERGGTILVGTVAGAASSEPEVAPVVRNDLRAVLLADADGDGIKDLVIAGATLQFFQGAPRPAVE